MQYVYGMEKRSEVGIFVHSVEENLDIPRHHTRTHINSKYRKTITKLEK